MFSFTGTERIAPTGVTAEELEDYKERLKEAELMGGLANTIYYQNLLDGYSHKLCILENEVTLELDYHIDGTPNVLTASTIVKE